MRAVTPRVPLFADIITHFTHFHISERTCFRHLICADYLCCHVTRSLWRHAFKSFGPAWHRLRWPFMGGFFTFAFFFLPISCQIPFLLTWFFFISVWPCSTLLSLTSRAVRTMPCAPPTLAAFEDIWRHTPLRDRWHLGWQDCLVNFNVEVRQQFLVLLHDTNMPVRAMKGHLSRYNCCDYRSFQVLGLKKCPRLPRPRAS